MQEVAPDEGGTNEEKTSFNTLTDGYDFDEADVWFNTIFQNEDNNNNGCICYALFQYNTA